MNKSNNFYEIEIKNVVSFSMVLDVFSNLPNNLSGAFDNVDYLTKEDAKVIVERIWLDNNSIKSKLKIKGDCIEWMDIFLFKKNEEVEDSFFDMPYPEQIEKAYVTIRLCETYLFLYLSDSELVEILKEKLNMYQIKVLEGAPESFQFMY